MSSISLHATAKDSINKKSNFHVWPKLRHPFSYTLRGDVAIPYLNQNSQWELQPLELRYMALNSWVIDVVCDYVCSSDYHGAGDGGYHTPHYRAIIPLTGSF